jgi:hypothetical protein
MREVELMRDVEDRWAVFSVEIEIVVGKVQPSAAE